MKKFRGLLFEWTVQTKCSCKRLHFSARLQQLVLPPQQVWKKNRVKQRTQYFNYRVVLIVGVEEVAESTYLWLQICGLVDTLLTKKQPLNK